VQNSGSTVQNHGYRAQKPDSCAEAALSDLWIAVLSRSNPLLLTSDTQVDRQITVYKRRRPRTGAVDKPNLL